MIPEEAKLAAEDTYRETLAELRLNDRGPFKSSSHHKQALHAALEAAAPYMLAEAWKEGCKNGLSWNPGYDDEALAENPYKKATK